MNRSVVALAGIVAGSLAGSAVWLCSHRPAPAVAVAQPVDFSRWAVVLVAGDYRAHSGAPSKVFDNARRDLATAFAKIGFRRANMVQFSVDYDEGTQHASIPEIAAALQSLAARAPGGCLLYFTSHGTPDGMIVGDAILDPAEMHDMVQSSCGSRPSVVVMSACFSGQFVPALKADNRVIMSAARRDRTSFGCGEMDRYTFFDDCFLRALPMAQDFAGLGSLVQQCVAWREQQMKATPPSEPQLSVGPQVIFTLRWRGGSAQPS